MKEFVEQDEIDELIIESEGTLDVRSSGEFEVGALPGAINIPLLDDLDRREIGTLYKLSGQESALKRGYELVAGEKREAIINRWLQSLDARTKPALYCARGGLRSKISQCWIAERGIEVRRVRGGYKNLRRRLIEINQSFPSQFSFTLISGKTGTGKTEFLNQLATTSAVIDLEELAQHRGSAFGSVFGRQPSQSNFENELARTLLLHKSANHSHLFLEAESRRIGRCFLPEQIWSEMKSAKILVLELPVEERVGKITQSYIAFLCEKYRYENKESALTRLECFLCSALVSISKHLGEERCKSLLASVRNAVAVQRATGSLDGHREWIRRLLVEYYDPHYEKHLLSYQSRIIARGHPNSELLATALTLVPPLKGQPFTNNTRGEHQIYET